MHTKEKNIDAFRNVYVANKDLIFKIVMRYSNIDYHVAQEITQEVFMKLYEHFDTYEEEYLLQWMIVAAKNEATDYLRRMAREIPDDEMVFALEEQESVMSAEETIFSGNSPFSSSKVAS